jgi:hypothetical protein
MRCRHVIVSRRDTHPVIELETGHPKRRLPVWGHACLIVIISMGSLIAAKVILFPEHPDSWRRIHSTLNLPLYEVRDILSSSGAQRISNGTDSVEIWRLQYRFGAWTVSFSPNEHDRLLNAHVRYDSTVFPNLKRMRNYPNP